MYSKMCTSKNLNNYSNKLDLTLVQIWSMKKEIKSKKEYHETIATIYNLMNKGENNLTKAEIKSLTLLSISTEIYENKNENLDLIFHTKK